MNILPTYSVLATTRSSSICILYYININHLILSHKQPSWCFLSESRQREAESNVSVISPCHCQSCNVTPYPISKVPHHSLTSIRKPIDHIHPCIPGIRSPYKLRCYTNDDNASTIDLLWVAIAAQ